MNNPIHCVNCQKFLSKTITHLTPAFCKECHIIHYYDGWIAKTFSNGSQILWNLKKDRCLFRISWGADGIPISRMDFNVTLDNPMIKLYMTFS